MPRRARCKYCDSTPSTLGLLCRFPLATQLLPGDKLEELAAKNPDALVVVDMELVEGGDLLQWMRASQAPFVPELTNGTSLQGTPFGTWLLDVPQVTQMVLDVSGVVANIVLEIKQA
jgi:hypothetical protein